MISQITWCLGIEELRIERYRKLKTAKGRSLESIQVVLLIHIGPLVTGAPSLQIVSSADEQDLWNLLGFSGDRLALQSFLRYLAVIKLGFLFAILNSFAHYHAMHSDRDLTQLL